MQRPVGQLHLQQQKNLNPSTKLKIDLSFLETIGVLFTNYGPVTGSSFWKIQKCTNKYYFDWSKNQWWTGFSGQRLLQARDPPFQPLIQILSYTEYLNISRRCTDLFEPCHLKITHFLVRRSSNTLASVSTPSILSF